MNCTDPNLPKCNGMCGCWHDSRPEDVIFVTDRKLIYCTRCGINGFIEKRGFPNFDNEEIWFAKGNFNRCKLCDKLANDYFEGNYFPDNSNTFVCAECCTLYTEDDLRIELDHEDLIDLQKVEQIVHLAEGGQMELRRKN